MNWTELIDRVAEDAGLPKRDVGRVLRSLVTVTTAELAAGGSVVLKDLCTLDSRWQEPRTLRSVADFRKIRLDGRWRPRLRPAKRLRDALANRTPQRWRDPDHQAAWRISEALVGDLLLYHRDQAPPVDADADLAHVDATCAQRFGSVWARARASYEDKVPAPVRAEIDHLAVTARARLATTP